MKSSALFLAVWLVCVLGCGLIYPPEPVKDRQELVGIYTGGVDIKNMDVGTRRLELRQDGTYSIEVRGPDGKWRTVVGNWSFDGDTVSFHHFPDFDSGAKETDGYRISPVEKFRGEITILWGMIDGCETIFQKPIRDK